MSQWEKRVAAALILGLSLPTLITATSVATIRLSQISAVDALASLPVKGRAPKTGFSRDHAIKTAKQMEYRWEE